MVRVFKIGDVVVGNEKANKYGVTRQGYVGKITAIDGDHITVETITASPDPDAFSDYGHIYVVNSAHFDLLKKKQRNLPEWF